MPKAHSQADDSSSRDNLEAPQVPAEPLPSATNHSNEEDIGMPQAHLQADDHSNEEDIKMPEILGILNINKPKIFTSHDVVNKLRKILKIKQIGHTGTLDPMAVGVLPVCIGKATKIIQYLDNSKSYRAFIRLGIKTDTYDLEGKILETNPVKLSFTEIKEALEEFKGEIIQKPPIYSAVHYKGKRLYEYARANIEIQDIPERKVYIDNINLIDFQEDENLIIIDIDCSGGTYIRTIANDLGIKLGCGASLADLIRTKSGKFLIEKSYTLEKIEEFYQKNLLSEIIINPIEAINLKQYEINQNQIEKIQKGQYFQVHDIKKEDENEKIQLIYKNKLAAIAQIKENKIFPVNVFVILSERSKCEDLEIISE
ncbi:MAG: tRNA pseudouridine(55) synthase TruB [bacterium]